METLFTSLFILFIIIYLFTHEKTSMKSKIAVWVPHKEEL